MGPGGRRGSSGSVPTALLGRRVSSAGRDVGSGLGLCARKSAKKKIIKNPQGQREKIPQVLFHCREANCTVLGQLV